MQYGANLVIGALLFVVISLGVWIGLLEHRLRKLLRGGKTSNIDETLASLDRDLKALNSFRSDAERYLQDVEKRLTRSIQSVGTIRYQAFKSGGLGGNQSFSSAFLSEKGDGVIISSIYSRDLVGIYAKPVMNHTSTYELTDEEKQAIQSARSEGATLR